jgi:hypothetical protein
MTQKPLLITLLASLLLAACKKEKNNPDDYIVRVGNQAFGAYLNGQPWVADYRDAGNGVVPIDVAIYKDPVNNYYYMWIRALKANEEISLYIPPPLSVGRKLLNSNTYPYPAALYPATYGMYSIYAPAKNYITTTTATGFIDIINSDTTKKQIEAKFDFEAINTTTGERVKITNGYFKRN